MMERVKYIILSVLFAICAKMNAQGVRPRFSEIQEDTVMYLYNVGFGGFLTSDNKWSAQASLSKTYGNKVVLRKVKELGDTYRISNLVTKGAYAGKWHFVFAESDGDLFTDQDANTATRDNLWTFNSKGNNVFSISVSPANKLFTPAYTNAQYLCPSTKGVNDVEIPKIEIGASDDKGMNTAWALVSESEYNKYIEEKNKETIKQQIRTLSIQIKDKAYDRTLSDRILKDSKCTISDLLRHLGLLRSYVYKKDDDGHIDFTNLIQTPNFDRNFGWNLSYDIENTGSITWYGGLLANPCAEAWQGTFEVSQEIEGLPDGLYRLDAQAFYRPRTFELTWFERDTSLIVTELFANEVHVPVLHITDGAVKDENGNADFFKRSDRFDEINVNVSNIAKRTPDGRYVPDNMTGLSLAFSHNLYPNSLYCYVNSGKLNIGITQSHKRIGSWSAWDSFRLTYLGNDAKEYKNALNHHVAISEKVAKLAERRSVEHSDLKNALIHMRSFDEKTEGETVCEYLKTLNRLSIDVREILKEKEYANLKIANRSVFRKSLTPYDSLMSLVGGNSTIVSYKRQIELLNESLKQLESMDFGFDYLSKKSKIYVAIFERYILGGDAAKVDSMKNVIKSHYKEYAKLPSYYYDMALSDVLLVNSTATHYGLKGDTWCPMYELQLEIMKDFPIGADTLRFKHYKSMPIYNLACLKLEAGEIAIADSLFAEDVNIHKELVLADENRFKEDLKWTLDRVLTSCMNNLKLEKTYEALKYLFDSYSATWLVYSLNQMAYAHLYRGNTEDAIKTIEKAIAITPADANLYDSKGKILLKKGDKEEAVRMWNKILELEPHFLEKSNSELHDLLKEQGLIEK